MNSRLLSPALSVVLAISCVIIFWPATGNDFVAFDDDANIYLNPNMGELSAARVAWAFSDMAYISRYMPLGWLTYSAAFSLWGLDPAGFHLASILLHAGNAILLFIILQELCGKTPGTVSASRATIVAFLATLWWMLHPMRAEVVAWATCLIYSVGLLFTLTAFAIYLEATRRPLGSRARFGLVALGGGFYSAAILTYPAAAGALAFVLAHDFYDAWRSASDPRTRFRALFRRCTEKLWFWIIPGVGISMVSFVITRSPTDANLGAAELILRGLRVPLTLAYFLVKPWWPANLTPANDLLIGFSAGEATVMASVALCLGLTAICGWYVVRSRPGPAALWIAFVGFLLPLCGISQSAQFPSDRYSYLGALPIAAALCLYLRHARRWFIAGSVVLGFVALAWTPTARDQLLVWRTTDGLLQHVVAHLQRDSHLKPMFTHRLARYRLEYHANAEGALELLQEAERKGWSKTQWEMVRAEVERYQALPVDERTSAAAHDHHALGRYLGARGEFREAVEHFRVALALAPNFVEARQDLNRLVPDEVSSFPAGSSP